MTCVSPEGRISPGCTGLYAPEHEAAWKRLTDFVHAETNAKICCQVGHSGRKGSTQLGWEETDTPLLDGNWPVMSASPIPWSPCNAIPKEMDRADMDAVTAQFVAATEMVQRAGFDMIELHAAHGYLISSFISPLSNQRLDEYGGTPRGPHAVSARGLHRDACRLAGRQADVGQDLGQRLGGRRTASHPTRRWRSRVMFSRAGADIIDVSAGQTSIDAQPVYGRMFQTPVLRPDPQRGRHRHDGGRQHLRTRPRQLDPDGGSRRPRSASPARTSPIRTGRCEPESRWTTPMCSGRSPTCRGREQAIRLAQRAQEAIRA